jgi:hypothetical protein
MTRLLIATALVLAPLARPADAAGCAVEPLTSQQVGAYAQAWDDWDARVVVALAARESTNCPTARNGRYRGLVQIDEAYAPQLGIAADDLDDPAVAIWAMHWIYQRWGATFGAWGY